VLDEMYAGVPVIYCDYLGYDDVAHHSGPDSPEALGVLARLDRRLASLEHAATRTPRRYGFVVLSDHGQTPGGPFRQQYGQSLDDVIQGLAGPKARVRSSVDPEEWGHLMAVTLELLSWMGGPSRALARSLLRRRGPEAGNGITDGSGAAGQPQGIVVSASGNLALVNFTQWQGRAFREDIDAAYPGIIDGLVEHQGIAFVMVRSRHMGTLVLGKGGVRHLDSGVVQGADPLEGFDQPTARHLQRLDSFPNTGDLVINSLLDPVTGEVAGFEEQVGSHGGAGGPQTRPFLLYPARWQIGAPEIVGAEQMHHVLKTWRHDLEIDGGGAAPAADAETRRNEPVSR
jgi:hypothetical protein